MKKDRDFYRTQIEQLANFILNEYPYEPGRYEFEGVIQCAIRLLNERKTVPKAA